MAFKIKQGVITLTPTAWKWYLGAALLSFYMPGMGWLIAIFLVLNGAGKLQRITLRPQGLELRGWWSARRYGWNEVGDFREHETRRGRFSTLRRVHFTYVRQQEGISEPKARHDAKGTSCMPVFGVSATRLVGLLNAYKQGYVPEEDVATTTEPSLAGAAHASPVMARGWHREAADAFKTSPSRPLKNKPQQATGTSKRKSAPLVQNGGGLFGRRD